MRIITQISLFDDTQNENLGDLDPFFHTGLNISDSLKSVRKSVLINENIIRLQRAIYYANYLCEKEYDELFSIYI